MPELRYHVAPKRTPGSPAQVDMDTALRVLGEEQAAARRARKGQPEAVVYTTYEEGGYVYVTDLATEKQYRVPAKQWSGQHWYSRTDRETFWIA